MTKPKQLHPDADLIHALGGPTKTARRLGYDLAAGGAQRVQNWLYRGIPNRVKAAHPRLLGSRARKCRPSLA